MSGRLNAAVPYLFVENGSMPQPDLSAPRRMVFPANAEPTAQKVADGDAIHYLEADVSAREGSRGRRNAPRSHYAGNTILRRWDLPESKLKRVTNRRRIYFRHYLSCQIRNHPDPATALHAYSV